MLTSKCLRCGILVFTILILADNISSQKTNNVKKSSTTRQATKRIDDSTRTRRAPYVGHLSYSSHRPTQNHQPANQGFFWLLRNLYIDQMQDTKDTYNKIRDILNNGLDEPTTTPDPHHHDHFEHDDTNRTTTTTTPRPNMRRIIIRNLRGLVNLYNKELELALRQSEFTRNEFNKQLRYSIARELH